MSAPDLTARPRGDARDAEVVAMALRHALRWYLCGLSAPPDLQLFEGPIAYRWPRQRQDVHLEGILVFGRRGARRGLVGVAVHAGWSNDRDRTRVAELIILDTGHDARGAAQAVLGTLFVGGATAVRAIASGTLAGALDGQGERPSLEVDGNRWLHIARSTDFVAPHADDAISDDDLGVLGALGSGGWPNVAARAVSIPHARIEDPSIAHTQLIKSSRQLRRWFYPRRETDEQADVVIVGAGIAGLTAAYALHPRQCLVLERETRLGGTARAHDSPAGRLGVGAHYEHEPDSRFAPEILALYEQLGLARRDAAGRWAFVDTQHYIDMHRHEQSVRADGNVRVNTWQLFETTDEGARLRATMLRYDGRFTMPSRLADDEMRRLERLTFAQWMVRENCQVTGELAHGIDVILRSDYGVGVAQASAFAALHFFLCRPYLTTGSRTFAPPEGLSYVVDRLLERIPGATVRKANMVRRLVPEGDEIAVEVVDLEACRSYVVRARAVVFAAPKKSLRYLYQPDAALFLRNDYATWLTVNCEHDFGPERGALCWTNHAHDPRPERVGFTWVNHGSTLPVVLGHYVAYAYAAQALVASSRSLVRDSIAHTSAVVGIDASRSLRRVVEKFGHAMPKPVPGSLFIDANARRACEHIVYAGVDTGRSPVMAEAFDSGLEAARALSNVR